MIACNRCHHKKEAQHSTRLSSFDINKKGDLGVVLFEADLCLSCQETLLWDLREFMNPPMPANGV